MINLMHHDAEILDQFTKQAGPFLRRHKTATNDLLLLMTDCAELHPKDRVLDIACGPGIVSCFFAERVAHVTGLDAVPAMLQHAQELQVEKDLSNMDWKLGDSYSLPFENDSFDCVVTRFSFHHYLAPAKALAEMKRVCKPGGTVLVSDVAPRQETQARFNEWEILRDPSHTRALTQAEMEAIGEQTGLRLHRRANFRLATDLDDLLGSSFPNPGDVDKIRALFQKEIQSQTDRLGVSARMEEGVVKLTYPITVLAWRK
ncbi:MAG: class I SAM-dependent methyltransferase [Acidobacteriaceae bacterium]